MNKTEIRSDIKKAKTLSDDEAIDVLWEALTNMATLLNDKKEQHNVVTLLDAIQEEDVRPILNLGAVESLIYLDPPLETILAGPQEGPGSERIEKAIGIVRSSRQSDPRKALQSLGEVLQSIRNKRAEGFQTPSGPRASEILSSARVIVLALCNSAIKIIK